MGYTQEYRPDEQQNITQCNPLNPQLKNEQNIHYLNSYKNCIKRVYRVTNFI